jgi:hypothetical protein
MVIWHDIDRLTISIADVLRLVMKIDDYWWFIEVSPPAPGASPGISEEH